MRQVALFILMVLYLTTANAELVARVDRMRVATNETFRLTITTDRQVPGSALDYSALNQDFDILGVSPQSRITIINGRQSANVTWDIVLLPKSAGSFAIPAFVVGNESTNPILIEVYEPSPQQAANLPIRIETEVSDQSVYVNQEMILTVRLLSAPNVSSLSGDQLELDNADANLLDQSNYSRVIDGRNWQVNEWRYAIFVHQSGELKIPAQVFSGVVGRSSSFDAFAQSGQRVLARSEEITLEVLAAPDSSRQNWLPAKEVSIEAVWSGNPSNLKMGEPMTRTIVVRAEGQQAAALPPMEMEGGADFRVYADQPTLNEQSNGRSLVSERRDSVAFVPSREGDIVLPEIRIPWWNIQTQAWEEALLPQEQISVAPATSIGQAPPPATDNSVEPPAQSDATSHSQGEAQTRLPWLEGLLLLLCLSLVIDNWRLRRNRDTHSTLAVTKKSDSESRAWHQLIKAIANASETKLRSLIIQWGNLYWPDQGPLNLHRIGRNLGQDCDLYLRQIESICYGNSAESLDRAALRSSLTNWRQSQSRKSKDDSVLPELYPR